MVLCARERERRYLQHTWNVSAVIAVVITSCLSLPLSRGSGFVSVRRLYCGWCVAPVGAGSPAWWRTQSTERVSPLQRTLRDHNSPFTLTIYRRVDLTQFWMMLYTHSHSLEAHLKREKKRISFLLKQWFSLFFALCSFSITCIYKMIII